LAVELAAVSAAPGLHAYLERIATIMKDKHSIADKFAVISMYLDHENNLEEVESFRRLKRARDLLSHGEDIPDSDLPTQQVQQLFEKYLRNHLRGVA
jgi:hypothetical protein